MRLLPVKIIWIMYFTGKFHCVCCMLIISSHFEWNIPRKNNVSWWLKLFKWYLPVNISSFLSFFGHVDERLLYIKWYLHVNLYFLFIMQMYAALPHFYIKCTRTSGLNQSTAVTAHPYLFFFFCNWLTEFPSIRRRLNPSAVNNVYV